MWRTGSKLVHPFNPELGVGVVREVEGRFLSVYFPSADRQVILSAAGAGLSRLEMPRGARAVVEATGEEVEIAELLGHRYRLSDGRVLDDEELWPLEAVDTPIERLAQLRIDRLASFRNRIAGLELMELREAGGLGSFLGGRIDLFPHQLHVARRAVEGDPVRWLLADEVGLGKTVEACLILSALVRTGRAERALVVAPSTLTIQWLGELYRKFHQVFVLLDQARIESVESDYGEGVNPFEVHPFAVVPLELLAADERLLAAARAAGLEAIVVDEAHRLSRPDWHRAIGPLVRGAEHALLLSATPLQADRNGFYELLSMLHPDAFDSFEDFSDRVSKGEAELPCTSAVRRVDVGGLPPRQTQVVALPELGPDMRRDPRTRWLCDRVPEWMSAGEKALVFVHDQKNVEELARVLESETRVRVSQFHEGLSAAKRDIEVASFRESTAPLLLCSEAGGEGRNFQFCDRMVHYDLPPDPVELEQRIGRLDRIGRAKPVEIVYFRHSGPGPDIAALYERLDLFARPAAGLDSALAPLRPAIEVALAGDTPLDLDSLIDAVERERGVGGPDLVRVFYRDAYTPDLASAILSDVPEDLETKTREFCVGAAEDLGFDCVEKSETARYYIELGSGATVDSLPGVKGGSRFLGSFDRSEAVRVEEIEFFANGHPLVEGLLLELEDGVRGRAALLDLPLGCVPGSGLMCVYKDGPAWQAVVVGADGERHPDWAPAILGALSEARSAKPERMGLGAGWADGIRALAERASGRGALVAAAFFRQATSAR